MRLRLEFVPDDFVATLMSAADVVVCPYQDILTAGSVIRAMSYSRPVITPRLGCLPETVPPAEGLSFDADAPDGLLKAMRYALGAGPASLASVAERNLESCKALAWDRVARATVTAYGLEPAS